MEPSERMANVEANLRDMRDTLARLEIKLERFATKADLFDAVNAQTLKLLIVVCSVGTAL